MYAFIEQGNFLMVMTKTENYRHFGNVEEFNVSLEEEILNRGSHPNFISSALFRRTKFQNSLHCWLGIKVKDLFCGIQLISSLRCERLLDPLDDLVHLGVSVDEACTTLL